MSLHNFNSNTKSWKMYTNTLTSVSGDDLLVMPSYEKNLILEVSANNDIFFKKGQITRNFDSLISEASFNSLTSQVQYILQEISGSSALNLITSGISNDLLIKSYEGQDIILEVSGNSEIIFKRGDFSYNLDDLIGGGSQSSDYATYNILDITGKIIFTDNSNSSGTNGSGTSGGSSNIVLTSISGNIIPSINNTFKLGDVSKNWSNAYITDLSVTNINNQPYIATRNNEIDIPNTTITPFGQDLSGETTMNYFGGYVSLSEDGTIMGVTAPFNNGAGTQQGNARIFKYNGTSWNQLGQDIDGEADYDLDFTLKLSKDGTIAAIGSFFNSGKGQVRIFKYNDISWIKQGQDIEGTGAGDEFARSISLSANGRIIAIGSTKNDTSYNNAGQVRVYSYNDVSWNKIGEFTGLSASNGNGLSVSLSYTGTILAISSWKDPAQVIIYNFSNNIWTPLGTPIYGNGYNSNNPNGWNFGNNIELSSDGTIIAIGERYNALNNNYGRVIVYKYSNSDNSWNKLGSDINGTAISYFDLNDPNITLSSDGTIIAVGFCSHDNNRGLVRLYKLINSEWIKVGSDLLGDNTSDIFGYSVSLSSNGSILAIGAPAYGPSLTGRVRTYNVNYTYKLAFNRNIVQFSNVEVSGNIVPLFDISSGLGSTLKSWRNAYIRDISATNIDISGKLNVVGATKLSNSLDVSGNVTFGGSNLYVPSSFTIDPMGHGDNTGTVLINGNLVVQGVTTTINSSVVDISDKMLVLASNASNSLQADGAGFEISGAKVNFLYNNSSSSFRSSIGISISGNIVPVTSTGSLGSSLIPWSNAYIRDVSTTNIEVSGIIVPLRDMSSSLGSSLKRWNNVFVDDLSVNKINGQAYSAGGGTSNIFTTSIKDISSIINVAQVGADITAGSSSTTRSDWFGRQVAMSGNGECIIVAASYTVVSGFNGVGSFRTYRYDVSNRDFIVPAQYVNPIENSTNTWRQYGSEILSPTVQADVYFGWGVGISYNGRMIAVASRGLGTTRIYVLENGVVQSQTNNPGSVFWSNYATISAGGEKVIFQPHSDPSFIIISNTGGTIGYVEVHNSNSNKTTWTRVGLRLSENTATVAGRITEGSAICISGDAKTIAYTVIPYGNPAPLEYVVIYSLSGTSSANWTWNRIATITNSEGAEKGYGMSIAMSYDGLTLAINQPGYTVNSTLRLFGRVKVYRYINSSWTQLGINGSFISSSYKNLIFGSEISLSPEGNILTVVSNSNFLPYGANINPTEYVRAIMIYIYDASSNTWINQGPDIIKNNDTIFGPGIYGVWETQKLFSSLTVSSYLFGSSYSNNPVFRIAVGSWNSDAAVAQTNSRIFVRTYQYTITNSKKQSLLKFNAETTETGSITISGDLIPNVSPIIAMFPIGVLNFWGPRYGCNIGSTQYRWNTIWSYYMDAFLGSFTCILTTSDDRLKHNEVIINNGLDIIDQLTPKFYQKTIDLLDAHYNGDLSGHKWSYESGLIAQELLQISDLSFVVSGGDYYDTNNLLIQQPYSVNYNNVFVYGLAAIKELHQKVKAQETSISSLQTALLEQQATINSLLTRLQALETGAN